MVCLGPGCKKEVTGVPDPLFCSEECEELYLLAKEERESRDPRPYDRERSWLPQ